MRETKTYFSIWLVLGAVGVMAAFQSGSRRDFVPLVGGAYTEASIPPKPQRLPLASPSGLPVPRAPMAELPIPGVAAAAVLVKDQNSGVIFYQKNPEAVLPIASLTKLMTALVVQTTVELTEEVVIESADLKTPAYRANLAVGEKLTVRDLLRAMLIASANDATLALARYTAGSVEDFVAKMNELAKLWGMSQTSFTNPVGFDDPRHYSSAADLALLVQKFLTHPELLEIVKEQEALLSSLDGRSTHKLLTTNKLLLTHPEVVGLKTGYTDEAKGNLIILTDKYYLIILGSRHREAEGETIMNWVKENFSWSQ